MSAAGLQASRCTCCTPSSLIYRHSLYTPLVISAIIITAAAAAGGDDDEDGDARRNDAN